jgi:hypothetical protein
MDPAAQLLGPIEDLPIAAGFWDVSEDEYHASPLVSNAAST